MWKWQTYFDRHNIQQYPAYPKAVYMMLQKIWLIKPGHLLYWSIVQFWRSRANCRCFRQQMGGSMTLTKLQLHSPTYSKLRYTVCSDTFLLQPPLTFLVISATVALLWDWTRWISLHSPHASVILGRPWPCHWCTSWLLVSTDHCMLGIPQKTCNFGDAVTQLSSHPNLAFVKAAHTLTLSHFSCLDT